MKKKKISSSLLALLLAVAMVLGQPGIANAMEAVSVETGDGNDNGIEEASVQEIPVIEETSSSDGEDALTGFGYKEMALNAARIQEKAEMSMVVSSLSQMTADKDYAEGEVVFFADSYEEAEKIAECYGGNLLEFEYGVGVIGITASVKDTVALAADANVSLPAVYPNVLYKINDGWETENSLSEENEEGLIDEADVVHEEVEVTDELILPCEDEQLYATAPNDTYYAKQWHQDTLNVVEAWNASQGKGVTVAIIDTGIDYNHDDLKANVEAHLSMLDYSQEAKNGYDDNGHGTHCSGIVAATSNNNMGVSGVAPLANICSVKVLDDEGSGYTADIVQGVKAAVAYDVDVISMSLGGFYWDQAFQTAINAAVNKGIVVIAAAGNESTSQKSYPAAYDNVIAVAATDSYNDLTYFSNYGKWVDIAAPGYQILSTLPVAYTIEDVTYEATGYGYMSGTSMACPVVAGVVALMMGNNSSFITTDSKANVTKVTKALINSCDPYGAYSYWYDDPNYYYPLVDAEASIYAVDDTVVNMPTISFSKPEQAKNVVTAGENEYFELKTDNPHAKIYYTLNGSKPTAKTGNLYTGKIYMETSGKVSIKAVAVVGSKTSKVFSKTYTFDVKATGLSSTCSEEMTVAKGKSIQLSVDFEPFYTSNKKLTWTSDDATGMIKVNKNGKVTCNKNAEVGKTATIKATTQDGTDLSYEFHVTVAAAPIDTLELNATSLNMSYWANNSNVNMKTADGTPYVYSYQLIPKNTGVQTTQYLYKSSNTKVAVVDAYGNVRARGKGKATITVTANDGSGKKATCKVNVVTPIFYIYSYSSTGFSSNSSYIPIGTGCSISMKTSVNYGISYYLYAPTNKKLEWTSSNPAAVSVNKSGKVTCSKTAIPGTQVTITATAADGFGASKEITFLVTDKITKLSYIDPSTGKDTGYSKVSAKMKVGQIIPDPLAYGYIGVTTANNTNKFYDSVTIDTSNRDAVYRYYLNYYYGWVIGGTKPGSSKITYTARDGSNTKFTINFKITK